MIHRRTKRFRAAFKKLERVHQDQAIKAFALFQENPDHPGLDIHPVKSAKGVWSGRINNSIRWTFEYGKDPETGETICWHRNIDFHTAIYKNP